MYAQVIRDEARSARRSETHERATHKLVSAMREQPGFVGAMSLVDRDGGRVMMVVLWETFGTGQASIERVRSATLHRLR